MRSCSVNIKAEITATPFLVLRRRLKAPVATVYAAWTEPERMLAWWGTADSETLHAETDLRVGGRYAVAFRTPDGERHDVSGVYREVVPNWKLVFSWAWRTTPDRESQVTVDLVPDGGGTLLTLTHERFFDEAARDRHNAGWSTSLDRLEAMFP